MLLNCQKSVRAFFHLFAQLVNVLDILTSVYTMRRWTGWACLSISMVTTREAVCVRTVEITHRVLTVISADLATSDLRAKASSTRMSAKVGLFVYIP